MHADGTLAPPPIALVEAQGYAYAAYRSAAELAQRLGATGLAEHARDEAEALREAFNRDFWLEDQAYYALALDGDKCPCCVVTSNVAHCLWTGIADESHAPRIVARLLAEDMFSGWGIRTLSANERRYNPMSYHNGSVWPHDNAIAAAGFCRYRLPEHAMTLASALFDASRTFEHARIPELFCGFTRRAEHGPVAYPVACAPQAWAAGSRAADADRAPGTRRRRASGADDVPESRAARVVAHRGDPRPAGGPGEPRRGAEPRPQQCLGGADRPPGRRRAPRSALKGRG